MASIEELKLSTRVFNAIGGYRYDLIPDEPEYGIEEPYSNFEKITTIEQLIRKGLNDISKRPNMGPAAINELVFKLKKYCQEYTIKFDEEKFTHIEEVKINKDDSPKNYFKISRRRKGIEGYVYAIEAEETYTKLGLSKNFPDRRIKELSTGCPLNLTLKGYIRTNDMNELENKVHSFFYKYHKKGEWFKINYNEIKSLGEFSWTDHVI